MNMNVNSIDNRNSQGTVQRGNDLVDWLAILLIGGAGMFLSLFGIEADNPFVYVSGFVIVVSMAVYGVLKCINEFLTLKDRLKKFKNQS